jgi:MFS family permease
MSSVDSSEQINAPLLRSLASVLIGSLILRAAAGAMGQNIQFYFNSIQEAARSPTNPLRAVAGAHNVYAISYTLGGIIIGVFFAAELLGALFFGAWSDRYGRRLFIILGPLLGAIAVQITAMTTLVWLLIGTRLLEGLSTASNTPATLGYLAEATAQDPKLRIRISGLFQIATIGGMAVGFSLGGWLWRRFGAPAVVAGFSLTSPAFAINAILYLASLLILWWGMGRTQDQAGSRPVRSSTRETLRHYWRILSSPRVARFAPAWIAINGVLGIWLNLTARILTDRSSPFHQLLAGRFSAFQTGNIFSTYGIFFVLGILVWTLAFSQGNRTTTMLIGTGGMLASCLCLFLINHQRSLSAPLVLPLVLLLLVSIMVQAGFTPAALTHLADITEGYAADRGAIMGLYSVFLGLGQFLGTSFGGPFVDWRGMDGMILATALLTALAAVLLVAELIIEGRGRAVAAEAP